MKTEIIKPNKGNDTKSLITPVIYLVLGFILAFKSNEATTILFFIIGIIVALYGVRLLIVYNKNKDVMKYNSMNLTIAIASVVIGGLLMILANVLEIGLRYVLGFFLVYFGISRLLTAISMNNYKNLDTISDIVLIIMGIFSIFFSNALLVIIGWILILNAVLLIWEYLRS